MSNQITDAERERYERAVQGLDLAIYELTWLGRFWGEHGALALERARYHYLHLLDRRADALSTISSTYYAAAGSLRASAHNRWFFLKLISLAQAKYFFEQSFYFTQTLIHDYGYDQLSTNQLDVIAHVLARKKRREQARVCINIVLARPDASPNNKALMYRLSADIAISRGEYGQAEQDIVRALELRSTLGAATVTRVLRTQAIFEETRGNHANAETIRREIHQISLVHALPGQDQKAQADL